MSYTVSLHVALPPLLLHLVLGHASAPCPLPESCRHCHWPISAPAAAATTAPPAGPAAAGGRRPAITRLPPPQTLLLPMHLRHLAPPSHYACCGHPWPLRLPLPPLLSLCRRYCASCWPCTLPCSCPGPASHGGHARIHRPFSCSSSDSTATHQGAAAAGAGGAVATVVVSSDIGPGMDTWLGHASEGAGAWPLATGRTCPG